MVSRHAFYLHKYMGSWKLGTFSSFLGTPNWHPGCVIAAAILFHEFSDFSDAFPVASSDIYKNKLASLLRRPHFTFFWQLVEWGSCGVQGTVAIPRFSLLRLESERWGRSWGRNLQGYGHGVLSSIKHCFTPLLCYQLIICFFHLFIQYFFIMKDII